MVAISGRLIFDSARTATASPALPGIANVPIVLQDTASGAMLAVLTDAGGNYSFINVPNGNYQVVEYYGMAPAVPPPGDFSTAATGAIIAGGVVPPLSYVPAASVPSGATNLDCVTPNTLLITVSGLDFSGQNISNGPVKYTPIQGIIDSHAVVLPGNLLSDADKGTFGSFPPGAPADSHAPANPYPGVGEGFIYTLLNSPQDGFFTIKNTANLGMSMWWRISDHTAGNETGRYMLVNGHHPGATIYNETVTVKPDTYYLFSTWILNMIKVGGYVNPALGVQILDQNGQMLFDKTLGQLIRVNTHTPQWVEAGSVIYSGSNSQLTVRFISQGSAANGNDYAIDDIGLYELTMEPPLTPTKTCSAKNANVEDVVTYTVEFTNIYDRAVTNVFFKDSVPDGLLFVPGSVAVNGVAQPAANPNDGFALPDVPGGEKVAVAFSAKVVGIPQINPTPNTAKITFDYAIVEGGISLSNETETNKVPLAIKKPRAIKPCLCCSAAIDCRRDIKGQKIWEDDYNIRNTRPPAVETILLRDGEVYKRKTVDAGNGWTFCFCCLLKKDNAGREYNYQIDEADIPGYRKAIEGFNVTNTLITGGFLFNKTNAGTGASLQGAVFEIRENGALVSASASDAAGVVSFSNLLPGLYQMAETTPPAGYMDNTDIYNVVVSADGTVTIDGLPPTLFNVGNTPKPNEILLSRATSVVPDYIAAPNTWPLHGTDEPDLYMLDKVLISLPRPAVLVKWAYGVQDEAYFRAGGGIDITLTYNDGFSAPLNTDYTVYAMFNDSTDMVASITIDRLRDGSAQMPYLLVDFATADALNPSVLGMDQFTLFYMQGNGVKLTQHYEIYEDIDMDGKVWEPVGPLETTEFFTGSLYGNGHSIANLKLGSPAALDYLALFRFAGDGASIQNLSLTNCHVQSYYIAAGFVAYGVVSGGGTILLKDLHFNGVLKAMNCGGITAVAGSTGSLISAATYVSAGTGSIIIEDCTADAVIEAVYFAAGILADYETGAGGLLTVTGCSAQGAITGGTDCAGIVGRFDSGGSVNISNSLNAMAVQSTENSGGITARAEGLGTAEISSCCNKGDIFGIVAAGIAGTADGATLTFSITNCYNGGKVNAVSFGGGIYAINRGVTGTQNCYNTADVISSIQNVSAHAGGISGNYGDIANCASSGATVSSFNKTARISPAVDYATQSILVNNAAFDNMQVLINGVQKSPLDTGGAGTDGISVSSAQIKTQTLYQNTLGWDFTNVWSFGNGAYTLPILRGIAASLQPTVLPPHLV